jgi:hypothetical protein
MSDQGKANYEAYRKAAGGPLIVGDEIDPEYERLPANMRHGFDAGADAVERWLDALPVDEDAPGSEPKPAKVIIVTEQPVGDRAPVERRFAADEMDDHSGYGHLRIRRDGRHIATYNAGAWRSVREDETEVPDSTAKALGIAKEALEEIARTVLEKDDERRELVATARDALEEIFTETEL